MQEAPNEDEADVPELVIGECELTPEGVQWLAEFHTRPQGFRRRMVELYIMIHGVPFRLADLLNWLGNQLVTHRHEYLHGPPKSGATGGNQYQSRMRSRIQNAIADLDTEGGYRAPSNPLLVSLGGGRYTLHANHVESICERNSDYLRPRTEEEETTSESDEEQESSVSNTSNNNEGDAANHSGTGHQTASYPPATIHVNVEGLSFAQAPTSSGTSNTTTSANQNTGSTNNPTPGFVYVLVRVVHDGENQILHHIAKIGEVGTSTESLDVESEMLQGGSLSNREYQYQSSTESIIEDTQGRFIHHQIIAVVPCENNRGIHERSGVGNALHNDGFGRIGGIPQQENYLVFHPQELGEDESGVIARRNALSNLLSVVRTYAEENDECHEMVIFTDRLQSLGFDIDSL